MLKIIISTKAFEDKDIGYDSQYDLNCEITIPEGTTYEEAMYGWFKALKVAGYSSKDIDCLMEKMDL